MDSPPSVGARPDSRRHPRCALRMMVHYHTPEMLESGDCVNISGGGILITRDHPIPLGTTMELKFTLPKEELPRLFTGTVVREHFEPGPRGPRMRAFAVAFDAHQTEAIEELDRFIREHLAHLTGRTPESFPPVQRSAPVVEAPAPPPPPVAPPEAPSAPPRRARRAEVEYVVRKMRARPEDEAEESTPDEVIALPAPEEPPPAPPAEAAATRVEHFAHRPPSALGATVSHSPARPPGPRVRPTADGAPGFSIHYERVEDFLEAYREHLSANGVFFRTATELDPGTPLEIRFELPHYPEVLPVRGSVVSYRPPLPGSGPSLGGILVEFDAVDDPAVQRLHELGRLGRRPGRN